ncbi:hypothetical protein DWG18_11830 [Lysobacter sp. TY2-98]|uniref:hypothetical protein n=1 Tax=Lysobacter sp. TY2-98 TaxID=2290922 RepID=UPI000E20A572|nr:hypothetical protein [Lysobacter sp. TY2-98]AXK72897.1 hypothetical protein DWG18_11830 [Lysobacter sp. TY2-98]
MATKTVIAIGLLALCGSTDAFARELSPLTRCLKTTFTEQLSGPVREQPRLASSHRDFIALHDGNFRWHGEPKQSPANLTYVYCFRKIEDEGGVLFADGKPIPMTRKAGGQRVSSGAESTMLRDGDTMETLYTSLGSKGGASTAIEILYDGQDKTSRLTMLTTQRNDGTLVMMTAPAVETEIPPGS